MTVRSAIPPREARDLVVEARPDGIYAARFLAMGCPCEILVAGANEQRTVELARAGAQEAWRIERKFSRYRADSAVAAINASGGQPVAIDAETERLLDYAANCFTLSQGLFDITCGVLRKAWNFDGSGKVPEATLVESLRQHVGFARLQRSAGSIVVPDNMQIDLGGIAKEYAVDCTLERLAAGMAAQTGLALPVLVNFGGDLRTNASPTGQPWQVGIEDVSRGPEPALVLELTRGALATSGDTHRFVREGGLHYGHILDPRSGWPVRDAPRSVTVAGSTCVEAGTLSTLAALHGRGAEAFLDELGARYWCLR